VKRLLVIPAAGRGSRLGTTTPKALVRVNGATMLDHLADRYRPWVDAIVVIAHPSFAAEVRAWAEGRGQVQVTEQASPTGMLDAISLASPFVSALRPETIWITWADQIGVLPDTLRRLAEIETQAPRPALALPTVNSPDPYTHFDRDPSGRIVRLRQRREGDEMPAVGEADMGIFALSRDAFERDLPAYAEEVSTGNATGERNFVPFVPWLAARKEVRTIPCSDPMERIGINTPQELEQVAAWLRTRDAQ